MGFTAFYSLCVFLSPSLSPTLYLAFPSSSSPHKNYRLLHLNSEASLYRKALHMFYSHSRLLWVSLLCFFAFPFFAFLQFHCYSNAAEILKTFFLLLLSDSLANNWKTQKKWRHEMLTYGKRWIEFEDISSVFFACSLCCWCHCGMKCGLIDKTKSKKRRRELTIEIDIFNLTCFLH